MVFFHEALFSVTMFFNLWWDGFDLISLSVISCSFKTSFIAMASQCFQIVSLDSFTQVLKQWKNLQNLSFKNRHSFILFEFRSPAVVQFRQ